jgi:hypothetical protein
MFPTETYLLLDIVGFRRSRIAAAKLLDKWIIGDFDLGSPQGNATFPEGCQGLKTQPRHPRCPYRVAGSAAERFNPTCH